MLWEIARPFISKLGEKLADYAHSNVTTTIDYKIILEALQRNLKSLSDKAFDVEKEVKNGEQSGMKKRKREVESWMAEVQKLETEFTEFMAAMDSDGFTSRFFGGDGAQRLSVKVDGLVEQSRHFGELLHACEPEQVPLLTKKLVGKMFEENFERIWNFLVNDTVSSVGINGMGGVGKTTLAKHVHNRFVEGAQHVVIWITVSQTFSIKNLQDEVAKAVNVDISDEQNEDKRAARLNRVLSRKGKVLIIFDDVWEKFNLEKIGDPLSLEECRLIITSRLSGVCHQIGCQEIIQVVTLDKSEALNLFTRTLGAGMTLTSQVQELAKLMAEQCGGLPLGIITAAGSMKGKTDIREWRIALKDLKESILKENGSDDEVFKILKYSFDRLDQGEEKHDGFTVLQHCFLNCCLYPEDSEISKEKLIELFISEGLSDKRCSRRERADWGHVMLNKLVNVCLLESDDERWVKMHDLVRAMALKITKNRYSSIDMQSFMVGEEEEWIKDLKKVSLIYNYRCHIPAEWSPKCPNLTTLLLQENKSLELIPAPFFFEMQGLHVLNLSYTKITELPDSLSNLRSLKSLHLKGCVNLTKVPGLGNLKELRELDISETPIKELPLGMEKLVNLECLRIDARYLEKLPSNLLLNFPKLQSLHLPFHMEAPMTEVEKLKQLEELRGRVKNADDFGQLMACLPKFNRSYGVVVGEFLGELQMTPNGDNEVIVNEMKVNEEGIRDLFLWPLDIKGVGFFKCEGLSRCMMDDVQESNINIETCKLLRIEEYQGVECIMKWEEEEEEEEGGGQLQELERMVLEGLPDLLSVVIFQSSSPRTLLSFSSLKFLSIFECNKMKKLGLPLSLLGGLQNLEDLYVQRCEEIEEIFEVGNQPSSSSSSAQKFHLPKLKRLYLFQLPKLKSICDSTLLCSCIEYIKIEGCTQVKKLPMLFGEFAANFDYDYDYNYDSRRHRPLLIQIRRSEEEWWASLELEHPSLRPLLQSFLLRNIIDDWSWESTPLLCCVCCFLVAFRSLLRPKLLFQSVVLNTEEKMLWVIAGSFLSKLGEKLADYAHSTVTTMTDYKIILEALQRNLKSLSDKASDVEKEVKNGEQSGMKKRKREVESWLAEVQILEKEFTELEAAVESDGFTSRFFKGGRAQGLSEIVDRLVEQSRHFGELLHACEPEQVPLLTKKLVGEKFEESFERIWNLMVNDGVPSIGIHGMGGVGKTTLAKHVHNRFVEGAQHVVIWITVSQTFSIKNLQDEVAKAVNANISDEHNEDKRAARLNRALSQRNKVLLIFDDVWEKFSLERIGDPLSLDECRLIITTRSLEVCHQIGCQEVIPVKTLYKTESWSLFTETLGAGLTLSSEVQEIAERMADQCGGLPLAIITTAGSMKGRTDICEWRNALTELNDSIMREDGNEEEKVFKILKYSFDRLDQGEEKHNGFTMVQNCFLNCCLYPEDSKIRREELIELLISEELLDKRRSRRKQMDQGRVILNKLVNVCLLESDDEMGWVRMHDLVRAMALKITKNKYLTIDRQSFIDGGEEWSRDLQKVYLGDIKDIPAELSPKCPKLSTLLLQKNYFLKQIPGSFFLEMHGLHVLNLSTSRITEIPASVSNLGSLRALLLSYCSNLKCVPHLGNLKELRELDVSGTPIKELPLGMQELVNLECLKINARKLEKLPRNLLLNFPKLQCLHLPFRMEAPMTEVEKLKQLEEFCGLVKDADDFGRLMVCLPNSNRSYGVVVGEFLGMEPSFDNEVVVNGTRVRVNEEGGRRGDVIPWPVDMKCVGFVKCEGGLGRCMMDGIPGFNISDMKSLKRLRIRECQGVECISKWEWELQEFPLQNLESMELWKLPDLLCVVKMFQSASPPPYLHTLQLFSSLRYLSIFECNKMKKLLGLPLSLLGGLQNLEYLYVQRCEEIEKIFEVGNQSSSSSSSAQKLHLPKLKRLYLFQLPKLKSICDATLLCTSIGHIRIEGCTQVKKLPLLFGEAATNFDSPLLPPPSRHFTIKIGRSEEEWWASLELEHPSLHPLLRPFLRFI
ncbi:uncharacterized protein LOC127239325 [Andrographis paniculata]|uniref:uncharacterized protein LOC127239325 n=1 Tax=Andrographis paniculata TaxID=175694 RepID=UPI0021E8DA35|nr:uncharacterized protein LOC127239325 [Andrographis paniculata]